jgi:hypothetical protein
MPLATVRGPEDLKLGPLDLWVVNDPRDGALRPVMAEALPVALEKIDWGVDCSRAQPRVFLCFDQLVGQLSMTPEKAIDLAWSLLGAVRGVQCRTVPDAFRLAPKDSR